MTAAERFWWLTPLFLAIVAATEVMLIVELRDVKRESRKLRESLTSMLTTWAVLTALAEAARWLRKQIPRGE